jgi:hypothetical protein
MVVTSTHCSLICYIKNIKKPTKKKSSKRAQQGSSNMRAGGKNERRGEDLAPHQHAQLRKGATVVYHIHFVYKYTLDLGFVQGRYWGRPEYQFTQICQTQNTNLLRKAIFLCFVFCVLCIMERAHWYTLNVYRGANVRTVCTV